MKWVLKLFTSLSSRIPDIPIISLTPTRFLEWGHIDQYLELRTKPCFPVWVWCWRPGAAEILPLVTTGRRSYHWRNHTINFLSFLQLGRVPCRAASIWKRRVSWKYPCCCRQKLHCVKTHRWELRVLFVQINATFEHVLWKLVWPPWFLSGGSDWDSSETIGNWSGEEEFWLCD